MGRNTVEGLLDFLKEKVDLNNLVEEQETRIEGTIEEKKELDEVKKDLTRFFEGTVFEFGYDTEEGIAFGTGYGTDNLRELFVNVSNGSIEFTSKSEDKDSKKVESFEFDKNIDELLPRTVEEFDDKLKSEEEDKPSEENVTWGDVGDEEGLDAVAMDLYGKRFDELEDDVKEEVEKTLDMWRTGFADMEVSGGGSSPDVMDKLRDMLATEKDPDKIRILKFLLQKRGEDEVEEATKEDSKDVESEESLAEKINSIVSKFEVHLNEEDMGKISKIAKKIMKDKYKDDMKMKKVAYMESIYEYIKHLEEAEETRKIVAKGISDRGVADRIAREKRGTVVSDDVDKDKFMVITKESVIKEEDIGGEEIANVVGELEEQGYTSVFHDDWDREWVVEEVIPSILENIGYTLEVKTDPEIGEDFTFLKAVKKGTASESVKESSNAIKGIAKESGLARDRVETIWKKQEKEYMSKNKKKKSELKDKDWQYIAGVTKKIAKATSKNEMKEGVEEFSDILETIDFLNEVAYGVKQGVAVTFDELSDKLGILEDQIGDTLDKLSTGKEVVTKTDVTMLSKLQDTVDEVTNYLKDQKKRARDYITADKGDKIKGGAEVKGSVGKAYDEVGGKLKEVAKSIKSVATKISKKDSINGGDEDVKKLRELKKDIKAVKSVIRDQKKGALDAVKKAMKESIIDEQETKKIKVEHPGVLNIPKDKKFWDMPLKHFISLGKSKGKSAVIRALLNLERWNKEREPKVSKEARKIIDQLKKSTEWEKIS